VGKPYPVDLVPGGPNSLTDQQNVHTVIHVVGPNMNPKRKNYLNGDYVLGAKLLKKAYHEVFNCFYERSGLASASLNLPVPRWCYRSTKTSASPIIGTPVLTPWTPYALSFSTYLDHVYNTTLTNISNSKNIVLGTSIFDFANMTETNGGKTRKVLRGTWFWQENDESWVPYATDIANQLEKSFQSATFERVDVSHDPPRFVVKLSSGHFVQYRQTRNATKQGRPVSRGFNHTTYSVSNSGDDQSTTNSDHQST